MVEAEEYNTFRGTLLPDGSSTVLKHKCRKCGKVRYQPSASAGGHS
jgi:hypothetical protein